MNIIIFKILLSIISGIILGLYFKGIALFIYLLVSIIYIISKYNLSLNLKIFLKQNFQNIFILIISIAVFIVAIFIDNKYETLYQENLELSGFGEIISFADEKNYSNKYIIKIKQINNSTKYKNTKLIIYVDKNINLEYGDIIYFRNSTFEKALEARNDKGFGYERYLRQSKIYGILNLGDFETISQNRGINYKIFKFRENLKNSLYDIFDSESAGFLSGILLRRKRRSLERNYY